MGFNNDIQFVIGALGHGMDFETALGLVEDAKERRRERRGDVKAFKLDLAQQLMESGDPSLVNQYAALAGPAYGIKGNRLDRVLNNMSLGGWTAQDEEGFRAAVIDSGILEDTLDAYTGDGDDAYPDIAKVRDDIAYQFGVQPDEREAFNDAFDRATYGMLTPEQREEWTRRKQQGAIRNQAPGTGGTVPPSAGGGGSSSDAYAGSVGLNPPGDGRRMQPVASDAYAGSVGLNPPGDGRRMQPVAQDIAGADINLPYDNVVADWLDNTVGNIFGGVLGGQEHAGERVLDVPENPTPEHARRFAAFREAVEAIPKGGTMDQALKDEYLALNKLSHQYPDIQAAADMDATNQAFAAAGLALGPAWQARRMIKPPVPSRTGQIFRRGAGFADDITGNRAGAALEGLRNRVTRDRSGGLSGMFKRKPTPPTTFGSDLTGGVDIGMTPAEIVNATHPVSRVATAHEVVQDWMPKRGISTLSEFVQDMIARGYY